MLEAVALTFEFLGKILIGIAVLLSHIKLTKERKIDLKVLKEFKREKAITVTAIIFLIIGYALHLRVIGVI